MRSDQHTFRRVSSHRRYLSVALQVLESITNGHYSAGDRLPSDRDLAEVTGVSRLTVREALLALEFLGVVQVRPGEGTYITAHGGRSSVFDEIVGAEQVRVSPEEVLEARRTVEVGLIPLVVERATPADIQRLRTVIDNSEALVEQPGRLGDFVHLGLLFHTEIARCARNTHLTGISTALVDLDENPLWTLLNAWAMQSVEARREQIREHHRLVDAIEAKDVTTAQQLARDHLTHLEQMVLPPSDPPSGE
ncbi:FadR/GntR family transcriptional regulator [Streptomyces sp. AD55]|uniref:FadR/GntR family transcriptional regulator n=1 Tax=Streptomyces sp. AD55 TaxID=3242895 RepID=UPI00352985C4